ncbi:MAG: DUF2793 domain-containing protein [Tsuneonella sp.]
MTDPLSFTSTSPRHELPFLFAGQAQKEFFVNEAHARIDALLHPAVLGEVTQPPASATAGDCWLVGAGAEGEWSGFGGAIACWQASEWILLRPTRGMRAYDVSSGQFLVFTDTWLRAAAPAAPVGGTTVDAQARDAIATLLAALKSVGVFAA